MVWMLLIFFLPFRLARCHIGPTMPTISMGDLYVYMAFNTTIRYGDAIPQHSFIHSSRRFFLLSIRSPLIQPFRFTWIFRCRYCVTFFPVSQSVPYLCFCACVCVCLCSILHSLCELSVLARKRFAFSIFGFGRREKKEWSEEMKANFFHFDYMRCVFIRFVFILI